MSLCSKSTWQEWLYTGAIPKPFQNRVQFQHWHRTGAIAETMRGLRNCPVHKPPKKRMSRREKHAVSDPGNFSVASTCNWGSLESTVKVRMRRKPRLIMYHAENLFNVAVLYLIARVCMCVCMMVRLTNTYLTMWGLQELAYESSCFQRRLFGSICWAQFRTVSWQ